ncbi:hypothetical protein VHEMI01977 [[Torrubiella] hemipterigena]|uniref:Galactose oxidase n=1 Tax=[Torrubiella] hemipterigena TaxID=1531966 RepID=A0A0A1T6U0_9HYPO|nr:hypothetical protein VHEMI01977 [[Torrubiella] hemipterigena]
MLVVKHLAIAASLAGFVSAAPRNSPEPCKPGTWEKLAPLPQARQEGNGVAVNGSLIVMIGGVHVDRPPYTTTDVVHIYNVADNSWRKGSKSLFRYNHPNTAAIGNMVYVLGGLKDAPVNSGKTFHSTAADGCFVYDTVRDSWSPLGKMPRGTARGSALTLVYGDTIFLVGGMTNLENGNQDSVTTVSAYSVGQGWLNLPGPAANLPEGRQHHGGAIIDDVIYVVGGRTNSEENRGTVYQLDLHNMNAGWTTGPAMMPTPRGGLSAGAVDERIVTFGGEKSNGVNREVELYDVLSQTWTKLGPMPLPRHGTHGITIGGRIYLPGGGTNSGAVPTDYFDSYCV